METNKYQALKNMKIRKDDGNFLSLSISPSCFRTASPPPPISAESPPLSTPWIFQPTQTEAINHNSLSTSSIHPYHRPYPHNPNFYDFSPVFESITQNPNPSFLSDLKPHPTQYPNPYFIPDFGSIIQNSNPNPSPSFLQDFKPQAIRQNPNPNPKSHGPIRKRRNAANRGLRAGKNQTVLAKYAWATSRRAGVKSLEELSASGIEKVIGDVQCRRCEKTFAVELEIGERFSRLREFISEKKETLRDRSAPEWDNPAMVDCRECGARKSAKAVVAEKKRDINWLFLLLGGFLCCCTLEQLKYFCKHTGNHRTGAKNRVLYLTYLALCKQLDPSGPFDALGPA